MRPLEMTAVMQEPFALVRRDRALVLLAETGLFYWQKLAYLDNLE